jgi:hypothetical protein
MVGSVFGMSMLPMLGVGVLGPGVSVGGAKDWDVLQAASNIKINKMIANRLSCIKNSFFNIQYPNLGQKLFSSLRTAVRWR